MLDVMYQSFLERVKHIGRMQNTKNYERNKLRDMDKKEREWQLAVLLEFIMFCHQIPK